MSRKKLLDDWQETDELRVVLNKKSETSEQKLLDHQIILQDLVALWRSIESYEDLFPFTAKLITGRLNFWDFSIFEYIPETDCLKLVANQGDYSSYFKKNYQQPATKGVIGWVAKNRKIRYISDVRKEKTFISAPGGKSRSELAVPVLIGDSLFAVINLESQELDAFDNIDIRTIENVAQNLTIYLEYRQNFEKQKLQLQNLELVNRVSKLLNFTLSIKELRQKFCDFLIDSPNVFSVGIYRFDEAGERLMKVHSTNENESHRSVNPLLPIDSGSFGWVIKNKKALYIPDISKNKINDSASKKVSGSEYCFPILFDNKLYGIIAIKSRKTDAFEKNQQNLLETMTAIFSDAHKQAFLHERVTREKEKTEAILDQMHEGVIITNTENRVLYANKITLKLFPQLDKKIQNSIAYLPFFQNTLEKLANNSHRIMFEHDDGKKIWRVNAVKMEPVDSLQNFLIIFEDITENKRAEVEKIELDKIEIAAKMAGSVAHELNQPLTGILGYCALLKEDLDPESKLIEEIGVIEGQADRIAKLIKKFQNLVSIKTKQYLRQTEIVDWEKSGVKSEK